MFKPIASYDAEADHVVVYWSDQESYSEHVSENITLHRAFADKSVTGLTLRNTSRILEIADRMLVTQDNYRILCEFWKEVCDRQPKDDEDEDEDES